MGHWRLGGNGNLVGTDVEQREQAILARWRAFVVDLEQEFGSAVTTAHWNGATTGYTSLASDSDGPDGGEGQ